MVLVFYYKDMLEKVVMQRSQQFSAFSLLPKEPSKIQRVRGRWKNCDWMKIALSEIRLFLGNHSLKFHEIWQENTLGNK